MVVNNAVGTFFSPADYFKVVRDAKHQAVVKYGRRALVKEVELQLTKSGGLNVRVPIQLEDGWRTMFTVAAL